MIKIQTIHEYTKLVEEQFRKLSKNRERQETMAFRGQSDLTFGLTPYLQRFGPEKEWDIIQLAKTSYPKTFQENYSPLHMLSLLQHYGIPTRLLDITKNAMVGLYFACNENFEHDGKVYIFKYEENLIADNTIENMIAETYMIQHKNKTMEMETFYDNALKRQHELIDWLNGEEKKNYLQSHLRHVSFIRLPSLIYRQTAQSGNYILFANDLNETGQFILNISPMPEDDPAIAAKVVIAAEAKKEILEELEYYGITEMQLFPENIDKGCKWLKSKMDRS